MEFLFTKEGWKFGEIGWRLPGGMHLPTESYVAGRNLLDWYLRIFIETETAPHEVLNGQESYHGYFLFPRRRGRVVKIESDLNYPWIVETKVHVSVGQQVPFENSSVSNAAHIIYRANSVEELKAIATAVPKLIRIEYE